MEEFADLPFAAESGLVGTKAVTFHSSSRHQQAVDDMDLCLLQGRVLGHFDDIGQLTMFADYRVPAVLREMGILQYSPQLAAKVGSSQLSQDTFKFIIA